MQGVPWNNKYQQQLVTDSRAIHERGRTLFQAVARKGGIAIHEQSPSSMAWLEPENFSMLQEVHGHITWVAACAYGVNLPKSWAFSCNHQSIRHLANVCNCMEGHPSFAGTQDTQGRWISSLTAEYPIDLARDRLTHLALRVTKTSGGHAFAIPLTNTDPPTFPPIGGPRLQQCDGAGNYSHANWSIAKKKQPLQSLTKAWLQWAHEKDLPNRIMAHTIKGETSPPLTPEEAIEAAGIAMDELKMTHPVSWEREAGQPYRLSVLRALGTATQDRDMALLAHLETGVPTGAISPLPSSFQWPSQDTLDLNDLPPLELCWGNWKAAEEMPEVVAELLQKELDNNWVVETPYTQSEAQEAFPKGVAIGKLNVVIAEGRDPRLMLDSSICNVNGRRQLPERVALPTALDIRLATLDADPHSAFVGAGLDFKAAHKQVKVRPEEHGLLMFRFKGKLYHYVVCHFPTEVFPQERRCLQLRATKTIYANKGMPHATGKTLSIDTWTLPKGGKSPNVEMFVSSNAFYLKILVFHVPYETFFEKGRPALSKHIYSVGLISQIAHFTCPTSGLCQPILSRPSHTSVGHIEHSWFSDVYVGPPFSFGQPYPHPRSMRCGEC